MTSQLNVDTIVDKAGSGGSNVKMANTSTYVSEGGAVTQNTVQGLSKCWVRWNMSGTAANNDSLGVSGITDTDTGKCTQTLTNPFNNTNYNIVTGIGELGGGGNRGMGINGTPTTTTTKFYSFTFPSSGGTNANDVDLQSAAWQGDLA